jgi:ribosomal-protein-serine acetyltransferase
VPIAICLRTPRLVIRRWSSDDAPLLGAAIDMSLEHLQRWMPWAMHEPSPRADLSMRLSRFAREFDKGTDWKYGIFSPEQDEVVGGAGLHLTAAPDVLEIGCWLRSDMEGRGLATEAVTALCQEVLIHRELMEVELRTDPRNRRSVRLAERLAFVRYTLRYGDAVAPDGSPRDTLVFRLRRAELPSSATIRTLAVDYGEEVVG